MLELGVGADILRTIGWLYLAAALTGVLLALWLPRRWRVKVLAAVAVLSVFAYFPVTNYFHTKARADAYKVKYDAAAAIFKKLCETAGDKVYRTVENVEGIRLTKMFLPESRTTDPAWEAAAFAHGLIGPSYTSTFLEFEQVRTPPNLLFRGNLNYEPSRIPGYRFVEVPTKDVDKFNRYSLKFDERLKRLGVSKETDQPPAARYSVSVEDLPQYRDIQRWIAGGLIQVRDLKTNEVLAEHRRFAFDPALGSTAGQRQQWLFADTCPTPSVRPFEVRFFVDQVLKPSKELFK